MEEAANGAEKIDGVGGQFFFARAVFQAVFLSIGNLPKPSCRLIVSKAARRVFHVWLQMIDGVAIASVALFGEFGEFREHKGPRLFFGTSQDFFGEAIEKLFIAGEEPAVEESEMKFRVVFFDALAFLERAAGGAYAKAEVPQGPGEVGNEGAKFGFGFFSAKEKKNIEIGVGEKQAATVTAEGDEGQPQRLSVVDAQNFAEDLLSDAIGEIAQSACSVSCALPPASKCCRMRCRSSSVCGPRTDKGVREPCMFFAGRFAGSRPGRAAVVT